jgi:hypothetical protein
LNISEKIYLAFYYETKHKWGKENYNDECTRKERMGIIWLKAVIWKLISIRKGFYRGRCPLCLGKGGC